MPKAEKQVSFGKSPTKTYSLVELVRAPTLMADRGPENTVFAFPVVALIELIMTLGVTVALLLMSLAVNAPLEEIANPNLTTDPAKAPWYLVGLQEMLEHGHPTLMAVIIPTILIVFVISIPYIDNSHTGSGVWFTNQRGKRITLFTALYAAVIMPLYIVLDNKFTPRELLRGIVPDLVSQWIIPGLIIGFLVILPLIVLWRFKPSAREVMLTLFTMLFVSAIVFTLSGFLFRGPGFKLYWPWDMPGGYNPFQDL